MVCLCLKMSFVCHNDVIILTHINELIEHFALPMNDLDSIVTSNNPTTPVGIVLCEGKVGLFHIFCFII